jgi:hypothetical protein
MAAGTWQTCAAATAANHRQEAIRARCAADGRRPWPAPARASACVSRRENGPVAIAGGGRTIGAMVGSRDGP